MRTVTNWSPEWPTYRDAEARSATRQLLRFLPADWPFPQQAHQLDTSETMPNKITIRKKINNSICIISIIAGLRFSATAAIAGPFVEPPVFASVNGGARPFDDPQTRSNS